MCWRMSQAADARHEADSPKRRAIIDAASTLFITQGYGAVSMDAIARTAGVSKATLYAYFTSKDALFATIINDACHQNMAVADLVAQPGEDVAATLTELARRVMRFLLDEKTLSVHRVVVGECMRFPELGRAFYENGPVVFEHAFGHWLRRQTAAGRLAVDDPTMAADQFIGMMRSTGVYLRATLGVPPPPTQAEIDATATAAVRTFLKAFGT